jgi:hypothetical protein
MGGRRDLEATGEEEEAPKLTPLEWYIYYLPLLLL